QGYGNVGSFFATTALSELPKLKLAAASDSRGVLHSKKGLDAKDLANFKKQGGSFSDYKKGQAKLISKTDELANLDVDILVLAALEDAINKDNMRHVKA